MPGRERDPRPAAPDTDTKKPTPVAPAPLPDWLSCLQLLRLWFRQAVGLILDIDGNLGQCLGMLAAVVSAEKQFP